MFHEYAHAIHFELSSGNRELLNRYNETLNKIQNMHIGLEQNKDLIKKATEFNINNPNATSEERVNYLGLKEAGILEDVKQLWIDYKNTFSEQYADCFARNYIDCSPEEFVKIYDKVYDKFNKDIIKGEIDGRPEELWERVREEYKRSNNVGVNSRDGRVLYELGENNVSIPARIEQQKQATIEDYENPFSKYTKEDLKTAKGSTAQDRFNVKYISCYY